MISQIFRGTIIWVYGTQHKNHQNQSFNDPQETDVGQKFSLVLAFIIQVVRIINQTYKLRQFQVNNFYYTKRTFRGFKVWNQNFLWNPLIISLKYSRTFIKNFKFLLYYVCAFNLLYLRSIEFLVFISKICVTNKTPKKNCVIFNSFFSKATIAYEGRKMATNLGVSIVHDTS